MILSSSPSICLSQNPNYMFDEACLDVNSDREYKLFAQYTECENCVLQEWNNSQSYLINTKYQLILQAVFNNSSCKIIQSFNEHGRYEWNLTEGKCSQINVKEYGVNTYWPIWTAIIIFICLNMLGYTVKCFSRYVVRNTSSLLNFFNSKPAETSIDLENNSISLENHPSRIKSIDAFRGICLMIMIFVNYGGGGYWFFQHAAWNGLTIADLVFPCFLWIMGFSIVIFLQNRVLLAVPQRQIMIQILNRSCILLLTGLFENFFQWQYNLKSIRIPGVLQRLGITYAIVAFLEIIFIKRLNSEMSVSTSYFKDIFIAWHQWALVCIMILLHTFITFFLPVPGCPTGYLGPGGLQNYPFFENCTAGAAGYIDRLIFGEHLRYVANSRILYEIEQPFDSYGLLGILTSVLTVYMGAQAAKIFYLYNTLPAKVIRWFCWALATGLIGGILCQFSKNDGLIPINMQLWSLSFALCLSSMAFFIQIILHVLIDVSKVWCGRPYIYLGMNSILMYVGSSFFKYTFPFMWNNECRTHGEQLAMNLWGTFLWIVISYFLYKKKIIIKV